jgi:hypothetical protein
MAGHAPTAESGGEVLKESWRATKVEIGFAWYAQLFEDRDGQPAGGIELNAQPVGRVGPAVLDMAPGMRGPRVAWPANRSE